MTCPRGHSNEALNSLDLETEFTVLCLQ